MPAGRPSKYKKEYAELLYHHLAEGLSFQSFSEPGVSLETLYTWTEKHPEFLEAKKKGTVASQHFWEKLGRSGAAGKLPGFNAASWIFNMKNRFGWRDVQQVVTDIVPDAKPVMDDKEIEKKIEAKIRKREQRAARTTRAGRRKSSEK